MDYKTLTDIIKFAPNENEKWDFKEVWHESNGELLRDIINFVNTPSHDDSYIIFGISDKDGRVVGIDKNDPNRKNKQQVQDYLRNIPFAQNYYPETNVETLEVDGKLIDVLTVYNTNSTPLFLAKNVDRTDNIDKSKKKGKPLERGLIYSRIGDSNTPVDQSTTDKRMEKLWGKRFRLDVNIYDRFKSILQDYKNWTYVPRLNNATYYIYTKDPDFKIEEIFDESLNNRDIFMSYSLSQFKLRIGWNLIRLKYRETILYDNFFNYFDNATFGAVIPDENFIKLPEKDYSSGAYFYYLKNDFPFLITMLIAYLRGSLNNGSRGWFTFSMLKKDVLFFENEFERLELKEKTEDYLKNNTHEILPNAEEIKKIKSQMKLDMGINDKSKYNNQKVTNMILDNKLTHLMIELYNSSKNKKQEEK